MEVLASWQSIQGIAYCGEILPLQWRTESLGTNNSFSTSSQTHKHKSALDAFLETVG